jgi:hypothetical protein
MIIEDRGYDTPCWISNRAMKDNGYTVLKYQQVNWYTHRFSYMVFVGAIPDGLEIDHLCRVHECCNPEHLEPVTCQVNVLRGESFAAREAALTHCKNGHPLSGDNLYARPDGKARECRACRIEARRGLYARRKANVSINGLPDGIQHGANAYSNWGCKCEVCVRAIRAKWAAKRAA